MGFEPTRAEPNGLAVHRLNHSATLSHNKMLQSALILDLKIIEKSKGKFIEVEHKKMIELFLKDLNTRV